MKLAFVDIVTTMNDLHGSHNCPISFRVEVLDETDLFKNAPARSKEIHMVPDEAVLGNGIAFHGITRDDITGSFDYKPLAIALSEVYDIVSKLAANKDVCIVGYGIKAFDLKILNEHFQRVLGKEPVDFDVRRVLDVEQLAKLCVDVRKCGNYAQTSVAATLMDNHTFKEMSAGKDSKSSIALTKHLLVHFMNDPDVGGTISDVAEFISKEHDVECFQIGKHKGMKISEVAKTDRQYLSWILRNSRFRDEEPDMYRKVERILDSEEDV